MTYDEFAALGLAMPNTEEGLSYGTPAIKRKKRMMFRLNEDGDTVALKLAWDEHDRFLIEHPSVIFKTPHYEGYPVLLVRLSGLDLELARTLIRSSWENAPEKDKRRPV